MARPQASPTSGSLTTMQIASKETTLNATQTGIIAGLVLGLAASQSFIAFLITLAVGVIGLVVGRVLDGELDLGDVFGRGRDR
ncbi:hypothetical protein FB471_0681 [Amycolatopsis cihanbeyliensis]|uniref:Small integral membrane protein DUF2273 n=1 Tax=Amycolatopsis cihanbeyliensis TaxID=1128664 RepID=A0A542DD69_AMYCI|nr:hypothetical protein FB471_0681 [Amycolatopsis cihanbeyliensis]